MSISSSIPRDSQILPANQWTPESFIKRQNAAIKPLKLIGLLFFRTQRWLNNEPVIKFVACTNIRHGWVPFHALIRDRVSTSLYAWTEQLFSAAIEMNYQMPSEKLCSESSFIRKDLFTALQKIKHLYRNAVFMPAINTSSSFTHLNGVCFHLCYQHFKLSLSRCKYCMVAFVDIYFTFFELFCLEDCAKTSSFCSV